MRRIIDKVISSSKKTDSRTLSLNYPPLPIYLSFDEISHMSKRGFLAWEMGRYLELGAFRLKKLYWLSMSKRKIDSDDTENEDQLILYISEKLLDWIDREEDVPKVINQLNVQSNYQEIALKVYEKNKSKLQKYKEQQSISNNHGNEPPYMKWEIYRDVIYAATQKKLLLIKEEEIERYKLGDVVCCEDIKERSDIPIARNKAKESLEQHGISKTNIMSWVLVISEVITNTLKHAQDGKMTIVNEDNHIRVVVEDNGPGFELESLPQTTLLSGYSTKKSLGQGFTLMMKMADQILLSTTPRGATIILVFVLSSEEEK